MATEQEDLTSLPLEERLYHKNWKARQSAYTDLQSSFAKTADEDDKLFSQYADLSLWTKIISDSNVVAQESGINALKSYLSNGGYLPASRTRGVIPTLAEKALPSSRAGTKTLATDVFKLYIKYSTTQSSYPVDAILDDLLPTLSHKLAKVIAATIACLLSIYQSYGCSVIPIKPVLKQLGKLFGATDKTVRENTMNLAIEMYTWIGDPVKPSITADMKPVQQKDFEDKIANVAVGAKQPELKILSLEQSEQDSSSPSASASKSDAPKKLDAFDLAEPQEILSKLPAEFDEMLSSSKWKDRKDALDALYNVANVPRLREEADYGDVVRHLEKSLKDTNVVVATVAANCVECLAKGLRKGFAKFRSGIMPPLMDRLKEKKANTLEALANALDAVFEAAGLNDILPTVLEYFKHKVPGVKLESAKFLIRCLRTTPVTPKKDELKDAAEASVKLLADTTAPVRDAAAENLGTLMKIFGERAMVPYLEGLDDIRKNKIKEFFEVAEVQAKPEKAAPKPPPAALSNGPNKRISRNPSEQSIKSAAAASSASPKKTISRQPSALSKVAAAAPASRLTAQSSKVQSRLAKPSSSSSIDRMEPEQKRESLARPPIGSARSSSIRDNQISGPEKAELESLRVEKLNLEKEKLSLSRELNTLQNQNAHLVEKQQTDLMQYKAKESQIIRLNEDLKTAQAQLKKYMLKETQPSDIEIWQTRAETAEKLVNEKSTIEQTVNKRNEDLEEEVKWLRSQLMGETASEDDRIPRLEKRLKEVLEQNSRLLEDTQKMVTDVYDQQKARSRLPSGTLSNMSAPRSFSYTRGENKENSFGNSTTNSNRFSTASLASSNGGQDDANGVQSWRSASEVTAALKLRIEQMKKTSAASKR